MGNNQSTPADIIEGYKSLSNAIKVIDSSIEALDTSKLQKDKRNAFLEKVKTYRSIRKELTVYTMDYIPQINHLYGALGTELSMAKKRSIIDKMFNENEAYQSMKNRLHVIIDKILEFGDDVDMLEDLLNDAHEIRAEEQKNTYRLLGGISLLLIGLACLVVPCLQAAGLIILGSVAAAQLMAGGFIFVGGTSIFNAAANILAARNEGKVLKEVHSKLREFIENMKHDTARLRIAAIDLRVQVDVVEVHRAARATATDGNNEETEADKFILDQYDEQQLKNLCIAFKNLYNVLVTPIHKRTCAIM
mmetsp:Transcript_14929/g.22460  ORF Transcript_14929/g.22460 Transcript_14929/m.22460 type:complete len:305 (+) Transcript_14929:48-962(+)